MSESELSLTSHLRPVPSDIGSLVSKVGFPIRKSADQSFFAAPHGLSQRSTSFIASQRQGIHRMPLGHLIALIINAHPARQRSRSSVHANGSIGRTLNRKTSLLRIVPTACGQAADESIDDTTSLRRRFSFAGQRGCRCSEIAHRSRRCVTISARSDPTSSRCQISRRPYQAGWLDGGRASRFSLADESKLGWWSQTESNRRPPACKAGALPTELWPLQTSGIRSQRSGRACTPMPIPDPGKWWAWEDLNFRPHAYQARALTN
jgi:hypothetical protein